MLSRVSRGCLGFLFRRPAVVTIATNTGPPQVRVNKYFVSDAEADFFRVLTRVVAGRAHVLAQVSLRQLLWLPGSNQTNPGRSTWQNKIAAKSVDFLLCDGATLRPLLVIELDEPTHARPHRQGRDAEVEQLLQAAGLPFVRVLTSRTYDTRELSAAIEPFLSRP